MINTVSLYTESPPEFHLDSSAGTSIISSLKSTSAVRNVSIEKSVVSQLSFETVIDHCKDNSSAREFRIVNQDIGFQLTEDSGQRISIDQSDEADIKSQKITNTEIVPQQNKSAEHSPATFRINTLKLSSIRCNDKAIHSSGIVKPLNIANQSPVLDNYANKPITHTFNESLDEQLPIYDNSVISQKNKISRNIRKDNIEIEDILRLSHSKPVQNIPTLITNIDITPINTESTDNIDKLCAYEKVSKLDTYEHPTVLPNVIRPKEQTDYITHLPVVESFVEDIIADEIISIADNTYVVVEENIEKATEYYTIESESKSQQTAVTKLITSTVVRPSRSSNIQKPMEDHVARVTRYVESCIEEAILYHATTPRSSLSSSASDSSTRSAVGLPTSRVGEIYASGEYTGRAEHIAETDGTSFDDLVDTVRTASSCNPPGAQNGRRYTAVEDVERTCSTGNTSTAVLHDYSGSSGASDAESYRQRRLLMEESSASGDGDDGYCTLSHVLLAKTRPDYLQPVRTTSNLSMLVNVDPADLDSQTAFSVFGTIDDDGEDSEDVTFDDAALGDSSRSISNCDHMSSSGEDCIDTVTLTEKERRQVRFSSLEQSDKVQLTVAQSGNAEKVRNCTIKRIENPSAVVPPPKATSQRTSDLQQRRRSFQDTRVTGFDVAPENQLSRNATTKRRQEDSVDDAFAFLKADVQVMGLQPARGVPRRKRPPYRHCVSSLDILINPLSCSDTDARSGTRESDGDISSDEASKPMDVTDNTDYVAVNTEITADNSVETCTGGACLNRTCSGRDTKDDTMAANKCCEVTDSANVNPNFSLSLSGSHIPIIGDEQNIVTLLTKVSSSENISSRESLVGLESIFHIDHVSGIDIASGERSTMHLNPISETDPILSTDISKEESKSSLVDSHTQTLDTFEEVKMGCLRARLELPDAVELRYTDTPSSDTFFSTTSSSTESSSSSYTDSEERQVDIREHLSRSAYGIRGRRRSGDTDTSSSSAEGDYRYLPIDHQQEQLQHHELLHGIASLVMEDYEGRDELSDEISVDPEEWSEDEFATHHQYRQQHQHELQQQQLQQHDLQQRQQQQQQQQRQDNHQQHNQQNVQSSQERMHNAQNATTHSSSVTSATTGTLIVTPMRHNQLNNELSLPNGFNDFDSDDNDESIDGEYGNSTIDPVYRNNTRSANGDLDSANGLADSEELFEVDEADDDDDDDEELVLMFNIATQTTLPASESIHDASEIVDPIISQTPNTTARQETQTSPRGVTNQTQTTSRLTTSDTQTTPRIISAETQITILNVSADTQTTPRITTTSSQSMSQSMSQYISTNTQTTPRIDVPHIIIKQSYIAETQTTPHIPCDALIGTDDKSQFNVESEGNLKPQLPRQDSYTQTTASPVLVDTAVSASPPARRSPSIFSIGELHGSKPLTPRIVVSQNEANPFGEISSADKVADDKDGVCSYKQMSGMVESVDDVIYDDCDIAHSPRRMVSLEPEPLPEEHFIQEEAISVEELTLNLDLITAHSNCSDNKDVSFNILYYISI